MFSSLHASARTLVLTALVGGSALIVPTAAGAQSVTPEQALLNQSQTTANSSSIALSQGHARPAPVVQTFVDGERALLNRFPASPRPLVADPAPREAAYANTCAD